MKDALGKATNSIAAKALPFGFIHAGRSRDNKVTVTVGDLIVDLTDDARRFVRDKKELYEVVAYLLEKRLNMHRYRWCKNHDDIEKYYTRNY